MTFVSHVSAVSRLQDWFHAQCDGDWEHADGVVIQSLDNPGWKIEVALADTPLSDKPFTEIQRDYESDSEWLTCSLRDGKFFGACGPRKLEEMIEVFLSWAEES